MANEMRSFTFGGTTHPVEDEKAGKTLALSGSTLQLKDADGTVRSSVSISTGGLKRYKVVQDWAYGGYALADYETGQTIAKPTKDELFLLMGTDYPLSSTPMINSGTQLYNYTIGFSADVDYAPHFVGLDDEVPKGWMLYLPTGKGILCFYNNANNEINILEDQYILCEMSDAQAQNMASLGIKYKTTGGSSWTNFVPGANGAGSYYTRSHIYLSTNSVPGPAGVDEILIGGSVGSQSIDIPWTIEAVMAMSGAIFNSVPKIYPVVFAGIDSTENAPYFKIGTEQSAAPASWNGVVLKQTISLIQ